MNFSLDCNIGCNEGRFCFQLLCERLLKKLGKEGSYGILLEHLALPV